MPTYQYACTECGHGFEAVQAFSDDNLTECPSCGGRLRKVFNSVGIVFKGSGFYRNDSRAAAKAGDGGSSGGDKGGGGDKGHSSTGDKSPAKADTSTKDSSSASGRDTKPSGGSRSGSGGSSSGSSRSSSTTGSAA